MNFRVSLSPLGTSRGGRVMLWGEDTHTQIGVRVYLPEGTAPNGAATLTGTIEGVVPAAKQEKKQSAGASASALRRVIREELERILQEGKQEEKQG